MGGYFALDVWIRPGLSFKVRCLWLEECRFQTRFLLLGRDSEVKGVEQGKTQRNLKADGGEEWE